MTAATAPATVDSLHLRRAKLPTWSLLAIAGAVVVVSLVLFAVTPLQGVAGFVLFAGALYLVAQTAVSTRVEGMRRARDRFVTSVIVLAFVLALASLVAVLFTVIQKGLARFDLTFLTHSMRGIGARDVGGGAYHAIIGTIEQVLIASALAVPFGLLVSIYLVEYGRSRLSRTIGFFVDVLTGLPSIIAGLFILAFWIIGLGNTFSGLAGALALTILMLPIVVRAAEEMLRLVPDELREASYALGVPRWRTILKVVIPTALPGIMTGVMLAVARVTGETAPLLLTVFGNDSINSDPFSGPQSALPLFVFSEAGKPQQSAVDRAWAGALTLILIVMLLSLVARLVARRSRTRQN